MSPRPGISTFTTSAPWSARIPIACGPESAMVRSTMRIPSSGPGMRSPPLLLEPGPRARATAGTAVGHRVARLAREADGGERGEGSPPGFDERVLGGVVEGVLEDQLLGAAWRGRVRGEP